MPSAGFKALRRQLDDLGYYQALVPESVPLVEALLHDLLATTHNLKQCKEQKQSHHGHSSSENRPPPTATSTPILLSHHRSATSQDVAKLAVLETKLSDLELLNAECMSVIRNLQKDVEERSKKILKLELAGNRAKIVTRHEKPLVIESAGPKIEMSSLVSSSKSHSRKSQSTSSLTSSSSSCSGSKHNVADLDLIAMYEKKNEQLDQDFQRIQEELNRAKQILSEVDRHWNDGQPIDLQIPGKSDQVQSSYMVKLVKDNAALKEQLSAIEQHTRICFHGKRVLEPTTVCCCGQTLCCYQGGSPGCSEDIRQAVEKSHIELHNQCLKNQLKHKVLPNVPGNMEAMKTHSHLEHQHQQIHQLQDELRKNQETNRDLSRRVCELSKINESLKDKLKQMSEHQKILLSSCNGGKVGELIGYIERQRDIYRQNVEELLDKLDPERRKVGNVIHLDDKENLPDKGFTGFTHKPKIILRSKAPRGSDEVHVGVFRNCDNEDKPVKKVGFQNDPKEKPYSPSAYQSSFGESSSSITSSSESQPDAVLIDKCKHLEQELQSLQDKMQQMTSDKATFECKFSDENMRLREEISRLRDQIGKLETANMEGQRKSRDQVSELRNETDSAWSQFQNDLRAYQRELETLRSELQTKENHLLQLSRDRDSLHRQLDERAIEEQNLRRSLQQVTLKVEQSDAYKSSQDKRVNQCMLEIQQLKSRLLEMERDTNSLRDRAETEKSLNREILTENTKLKTALKNETEEKDASQKQVEDLRANIQRYVNEVKRIEELLALREKERMELLDQYKHLADEVDSAETYGRKLESQVSQMRLELSTRTAELQASELRLENMEKDLVEISLSNENYREQVARLSSKVDIAESELRSLRSTSTWMTSDLTDVHQLAEQLNAQKLELQQQLNEQAREMEHQNEEIQNLKCEINQLSQMIESERRKSAELERRMVERRPSTGSNRQRDIPEEDESKER